MLELQKFLADHKPEEMTDKYAVTVKRHPKYPNLVLFKYSMIDSPLGERIVQECRGIILDEANKWAVVSYPYDKFFNHGEGHAANIDWSTAKVFEKVDGSLMTLYWHDGKWNVASSGTPDAGGDVYMTPYTFEGLFWKVWNDLGYVMPSAMLSDYCFMFELCTPFNKIVVQHPKSRIVFHGMRNVKTLAEVKVDNFHEFMDFNWEVIKSYPLQTIEQVLATCDAIKPTEGEGYVICDAAFHRVKIKTPQYVAISHMRDGMGTRRMLEVVRIGESEEVLAYFPEFKSLHDQLKEKYDELVVEIEASYAKVKDIPLGENEADRKSYQKQFALAVKDTRCNGVLFHLRKGTFASVKEALKDMSIKNLVEILKVKDIVIEM